MRIFRSLIRAISIRCKTCAYARELETTGVIKPWKCLLKNFCDYDLQNTVFRGMFCVYHSPKHKNNWKDGGTA